MLSEILLLLFIFPVSYFYKTEQTPYLCTESSNETPQTLPSCLPGYIIDIENVSYESTTDETCSGITLCRVENKNTLLTACNRKRTCNVELQNLRFHINATCGLAIRLFIKYRCLPVIQEQKDYLCEASTPRRMKSGDINLSCERNYRLHITMALIGVSMKQQDDTTKNRFKCNKDTQWMCHTHVPTAYQDVCETQFRQGNGDQCKIRYNERPPLKDCPSELVSNFSLVEYSCIPGDGIKEDLPRIDICSTEIPERITSDRGLLHSRNYPERSGQYLTCRKQLYVSRESRLRLFMLEKSIEYSHELNIYLSNMVRPLATNELLDINITKSNDEIVQFELKTNHFGGSHFLLYFQVDSRLSEYAPYVLEAGRRTDDDNRRGKLSLKRDWGIVLGCILGLLLILLVIAIIFTLIRISKRRRARALRYLKSDDDHRQHLNAPKTSPDHHQNGKNLQIEQPYLASSSPVMLSSVSGHNRPHSASSTTSSILMNQGNDGISDRESLIKPIGPTQSQSNNEIDNFYEEIKEQQQQTALALGINADKGDLINPYLEAKSVEPKKTLFQGNRSSQPIRDHHEIEPRYQQPTKTESSDSTNEPIKRPKKPPPKIPTDIKHPEPSAPPLHLIEEDNRDES